MLWAFAIGCARAPLAEVEIDGGTPELRATVRALLALFDEAAGTGRVELRAIRIRPSPSFHGRYNPTNQTLTLAEEASPLSQVVWHELCHALFAQDDLGRQLRRTPAPPIVALTELVFEAEATGGRPHRLPLPTPSRRRSEAVALICQAGPYWAADAAAGTCTRRAEPLTEGVAGWLLEHVWSAFALPEPLELDPADAIRVDPAVLPVRHERVAPTADPRVLAVDPDPDGSGGRVHLDLYSGARVDSELPPLSGARDLPSGLGMWLSSDESLAGWASGPAAIEGSWLPEPLAGSQNRLLVYDGGSWRFVGDSCGRTHWLFTADDRLWLARWDDGLWWAELGRR